MGFFNNPRWSYNALSKESARISKNPRTLSTSKQSNSLTIIEFHVNVTTNAPDFQLKPRRQSNEAGRPFVTATNKLKRSSIDVTSPFARLCVVRALEFITKRPSTLVIDHCETTIQPPTLSLPIGPYTKPIHSLCHHQPTRVPRKRFNHSIQSGNPSSETRHSIQLH